MMSGKERKDEIGRVVAAINQLLDNQDIQPDEDWAQTEEAWDVLSQLVPSEEIFTCDSVQLKLTNEEKTRHMIFARCPEELNDKDALKKLQDGLIRAAATLQEKITAVKPQQRLTIQIFVFADNLERKIAIETYFDGNKCRDMAKSIKGKRPTLRCRGLLLAKRSEEPVCLKGIQAYEAISHPSWDHQINMEKLVKPGETAPAQALVFTLPVYSLVKLYNQMGEALFQNNVRFGIKDVMGVDRAIKATLEKNPDEFWFKNNGITIVTQRPINIYREVTELNFGMMEERAEHELPLSVVNGAQTISAAADFFYREKYRCQQGTEEEQKAAKERLEQIERDALVLVRVICVTRQELGRDLTREISVALNRQKPIQVTDIAFTTPEVQKLVEYLATMEQDNEQSFQIMRRGERGDGQVRCLELEEFARARKACCGRPDKARSSGATELLRVQTNEKNASMHMADRDLFPQAWSAEGGEALGAYFQRDYSAIWFAHQTALLYEKSRKEWWSTGGELGHEERWIAMQNGKWYCVAALVYLLNGAKNSNEKDFSGFPAAVPIGKGNIKEIAECMADLMVFALRQEKDQGPIDANTFKKQETYNALKKVLSQETKCDQVTQAQLDKLMQLVGQGNKTADAIETKHKK